ncbi:MAG: hypothetical protein NT060_04600 [Candidatus Omnitrophica bacterium]|nr:hypothetical protein [Candidatus Omnitrophota bacterium]
MNARRGQSTAEYFMIMLAVMAALVVSAFWVKMLVTNSPDNIFQKYFGRTSGIIAGTRH